MSECLSDFYWNRFEKKIYVKTTITTAEKNKERAHTLHHVCARAKT